MTKELDAAPGDIRALKHRIHELEGEVIGYKRILDAQEPTPISQAVRDYNEVVDKYNKLLKPTPPVAGAES